MSDKTEEEKEIERQRDRKGKRKMHPDDETEEKTGEQNPASFPSELDSANLSLSYEMYRREGGSGSLDDFMKQQQYALDRAQKSHLGRSSLDEIEEDAEGNKKTGDFGIFSPDSDALVKNIDPIEELIFELEIFDKNRLIIPYASAFKFFPHMVDQPNTEETLHFHDPLKKMWEMTLIFDINTQSYVITNGWSRYLEHNQLIPSDLIQVYLPIPQKSNNEFNIKHQKDFGQVLFEVVVPRSNRMRIPYSVGQNYLNPSDPDHLTEYPINLTDFHNCKWEMRYVLFEEEDVYIIGRGWGKYATRHVLKCGDMLRFYRDRSGKPGNNFIISHELSPWLDSFVLDSGNDAPLWFRDKLLFEMNLSEEDVRRSLKMPGVEFPFECSETEMLKLTDKNKKDWYVMIVDSSISDEYMIIDGWEGIVREHKLAAGDMVRFFVPDDPDHDMHFQIEFVKMKKNDTKKEEGGSGVGKSDNDVGRSHEGKEVAE